MEKIEGVWDRRKGVGNSEEWAVEKYVGVWDRRKGVGKD